jgi:AcrR family transcriptional regulator
MVKEAADTRNKLVREGTALVSREGLSGVSIGQLAEQVGMSKSGVFAHFRSKEQVQISLLEHSAQLAGPTVVEPAMVEPEGLPRLQAIFRNWLSWSRKAGLPGGCPVAAAMFELDDMEGPLRDKVVEMEAQWRVMLGQFVGQAVERGHLRSNLDIDQFVWELCGIYLSHHVAERFVRDPKADDRAAIAFQALITRAKPLRGKTSKRT